MNFRRLANPAFLTAVLVMSAAAIGMQTAISHYKIFLKKKPIYPEPFVGESGKPEPRMLQNLPATTEHFVQVGVDYIESAETLETLGTDNYLTRTYAQREPGPDGRKHLVQLHVAYYTGMIDTVPHVPERCLTGGGLELVGDSRTVEVPLRTSDWRASPDAGQELEGRLFTTRLSNEYSRFGRGQRVNLPRDLTPMRPLALRTSEYAGQSGPHLFAGYFFVANGGWVSSAEQVRLLAFDLKTDYAYYLKVQVGSSDVGSPEELATLAGGLLDDLLGEIMSCVPDWARVQRHLWPRDNDEPAQTPAGGRP